jgi:hypothetical protein
MQELSSSALMAGLRMQQEADQNEAAAAAQKEAAAAAQKPAAPTRRGSTVGGEGRKSSRGGASGSADVAAPKPVPRPLDNLKSSHERVAALGGALVHLWQQQREIEAYLPNQGPFFVAAGTSPNVPCYLRWSGRRLLQRRWPKRDTENMVEDIWKKKRLQNEARDREGKALMTMDEYLLQYMQMKYGLEHLVAENTYNFLDACKRYVYDSDMALFLAVLQGTMGEEEELQQQAELETIAKAMVDRKGNEARISNPKPNLHPHPHLHPDPDPDANPNPDPNLTVTLALTLTLSLTPTKASISKITALQLLPRLFLTRRLAQLEELKDALVRSLELAAAGNKDLLGKDFKLQP